MPANAASRISAVAQRLFRARLDCRPIPIITRSWPSLDEPNAYAIAAAVDALVAEPVVGFKLGYTSAAMREQMQVDEPNYGSLYASTLVGADGRIASDTLMHPLVEPEIALRIARDIGNELRTAAEAAAVVDAVMPALEIVDTRYESYHFTAADNIADNSSAARFVLGAPQRLEVVGSLREIPVRLARDGVALASGSGADVMGDPLLALSWFVSRRIREGKPVRAGTVILTGGVCTAHPAPRGSTFAAAFGALGTAACSVA